MLCVFVASSCWHTTEAFADTHPRVREAGKQALDDIGSVIRNPEVASLSGVLMSALSDARSATEHRYITVYTLHRHVACALHIYFISSV